MIEQLLSGLIGSLIGVLITIVLYWHNRYTSARQALFDRLTILKHDVWFNCTDADVFKTWDASLKEIWVLYNAVYATGPFWLRGRIKKAWVEYKGEDQEILTGLNFCRGI